MTVIISTNKKLQGVTSFKGGTPKIFTIKNEIIQKYIEKAGGLSTPANRLFLGATALALQPMIDLRNKNVDDKTRKVSCARTTAKIIIGTITGIAVRTASIKCMDIFTFTPKDLKDKKHTKWSTMLVPTDIPHEEFGKALRLLKRHRQALGSIVALFVMLFTNFLVDAPLTRILTNIFTRKMDELDQVKSNAKVGE